MSAGGLLVPTGCLPVQGPAQAEGLWALRVHGPRGAPDPIPSERQWKSPAHVGTRPPGPRVPQASTTGSEPRASPITAPLPAAWPSVKQSREGQACRGRLLREGGRGRAKSLRIQEGAWVRRPRTEHRTLPGRRLRAVSPPALSGPISDAGPGLLWPLPAPSLFSRIRPAGHAPELSPRAPAPRQDEEGVSSTNRRRPLGGLPPALRAQSPGSDPQGEWVVGMRTCPRRDSLCPRPGSGRQAPSRAPCALAAGLSVQIQCSGPVGLSSSHWAMWPCHGRGTPSPGPPPPGAFSSKSQAGPSQKAGQLLILREPPSSGAPAQLRGPTLRPRWPPRTPELRPRVPGCTMSVLPSLSPEAPGLACRAAIQAPVPAWSPQAPGLLPRHVLSLPGLLSGEDLIISE